MELNMQTIGKQKIKLWDHTQTTLGDFWQQGPVVLVFLRHYG
jgi:hypothetical protein